MMFGDEPVSDVEVVLRGEYAGRNAQAIEQLTAKGLKVLSLDDEHGVVEGLMAAEKVSELKGLDCVAYVRNIFTYMADTRPGEESEDEHLGHA